MYSSFVEHPEYRVLRNRMHSAGLLQKTPYRHTLFAIGVLSVCAALYTSLFFVPPPYALILAVALAFVMLWSGFLGHDLSHGQIFRSKVRQNTASVFVWNFLNGISSQFWEENHGGHHQKTNVVGQDPDMMMPFIFSNLQDEYPSKLQRLLTPILRKHQHIYFFLLFPIVYSSYAIKSVPKIFCITHKKRMFTELALYTSHFVLFFALVFSALGVIWGIMFTIIHAFSLGTIMSIVFAPNHKGMPMLGPADHVSYRTQILSTRNIHPSLAIDFLYGGLNYQIEHHLFPYVSRFYLSRARNLVREFCSENGIPYYETTPIQSFREIYQSLKGMSR